MLIWNAEAGGLPKAASKGVAGNTHNGMLTNGNGASEEEDELGDNANCSLSWDAEGGKLALGFGSQVASSFRPESSQTRLTATTRLRSSTYGIEE